jgi:putative ABC transport system substrate-binding protein
MRRREFIRLLSGAAAAWPLAAEAQQLAPLVATLITGTGTTIPAFEQGLEKAGYLVGRDADVEYHWVGSEYEQLASTAADFGRRRVAVIVKNSPRPRKIDSSSVAWPLFTADRLPASRIGKSLLVGFAI